MAHQYGSKRLELRRPPLIVSGLYVVGGGLLLALALVGILYNWGIVSGAYEFIRLWLSGPSATGYEVLVRIFYLLSMVLYVGIVVLLLVRAIMIGANFAVSGLTEIFTWGASANIPAAFRDHNAVRRGFREGILSIYEPLAPWIRVMFGRRAMFLTPVRRQVLDENAGKLRGRLVGLLVVIGLLLGLTALANWLASDLAADLFSGIGVESLPLVLGNTGSSALRPLLVALLVLVLMIGLAEIVIAFLLIPRGEPSTEADDASEFYRGFGHPSHLLARLPDVGEAFRWNGFKNRAKTSWKENPSAAIGDVGEFKGHIFIEQQPRPVAHDRTAAPYLLLVVGWLLLLTGYGLGLFFLLPAALRQPGAFVGTPALYAPAYILLVGSLGILATTTGRRFARQAWALFEATLFQAQAILIEFVGSMSRADLRVGKSVHDSIESSSVVARSDFTARFWAAELLSEAAHLDAPRDLLALSQSTAGPEWIRFFRSQIHELRGDGVKTMGIDFRAPEVEDVTRANMRISAMRQGLTLPQGDEAASLMSPRKRWVLVSSDGRTVSLGRNRLTIGRASENDLVIDEPLLSRQHAAIEFDGHRYLITDLDSTYGTTLNGQRLDSHQPYPLRPGDLLTLASRTTFVVRDSEPSKPLPADRDRLPPTGSLPSQE